MSVYLPVNLSVCLYVCLSPCLSDVTGDETFISFSGMPFETSMSIYGIHNFTAMSSSNVIAEVVSDILQEVKT